MKKPLAWAVALGVLPVIGLGLLSEWASRQRLADSRVQIVRLLERREQLGTIRSRVESYQAQRKMYEEVSQIVDHLREGGGDSPSRAISDVATIPETAALDLEAVWAQDGFLELRGRARTPAEVNRAGQALEQRGHLDAFDVWRFDPDGHFALLGRMPEPTPRGRR